MSVSPMHQHGEDEFEQLKHRRVPHELMNKDERKHQQKNKNAVFNEALFLSPLLFLQISRTWNFRSLVQLSLPFVEQHKRASVRNNKK